MPNQEQSWQIRLAPQPEQMLARLSPDALQQLDQAILALSETPYPFTSRPILAHPNLYRLRVNAWRVTYSVEAEELLILILEIAPAQQAERYKIEETDAVERSAHLPLAAEFVESQEKNILSHRKIRLLIVDDIPETRENLRRLLHFESDVEIVGTAASGEEAIRLATQHRPDLILMDVLMPGLDGLATTERLCELLPKSKVIMMSVQGDAATYRRAMLAGAKEFLIKPFSSDELKKTIQRVSGNSPGRGGIESNKVFQGILVNNLKNEPANYGTLFEGFESGSVQNFTAEVLQQLTVKLDQEDEAVYPEGATWYALQCNKDYEANVKQNLQHRLEVMGLQDKIFRVVILHERTAPQTGELGETKYRENFPGFIFVKMLLDEDSWYVVKNTPGVTGWFNLEEGQGFTLIRGGGGLLKRIEKQQTQSEEYKVEKAARDLQAYKLGQYVEISLSVRNLATSLAFYQQLGLQPVDGGETPYPWAILSDGTLHVGLHQHYFPSPTLNYFASYTPDQLDALQKLGIPLHHVQTINKTSGMQDGEILMREFMIAADFETPEATRIGLASSHCEIEPNLSRTFFSTCEKFGELSFQTTDVITSLDYWSQFGFEPIAQTDQPYPSAIISDGRIRLGLHQTTKFTKPTISYFSLQMPDRLRHLKKQGVRFVSEQRDAQGRPLGAMLRSPDGQPVVLFAGQISN